MIQVGLLVFEVPEIDWCPWCGEPETDGDFCDLRCARDWHTDVRCSGEARCSSEARAR